MFVCFIKSLTCIVLCLAAAPLIRKLCPLNSAGILQLTTFSGAYTQFTYVRTPSTHTLTIENVHSTTQAYIQQSKGKNRTDLK